MFFIFFVFIFSLDYNKNMNKELLNSLFEILSEKDAQNKVQLANTYDVLMDTLENIKDIAFVDLVDGNISIIPYGDYISNTFYDGSLVEFLIVFHTSRENIDFTTPLKRITKKGKVKLSTYQQIVGAPVNHGVIQAEEIVSRFTNYIKGVLAPSQKIYSKYNTIMIKLNKQLNAKITVCYDANFDKNKLLVRRINTWTYINPSLYLSRIEQKDKETNFQFSKFVKLFKALEIELIIAQESNLLIGRNYFVENLLYNVPSNLFLDEDSVVMNNIMFYLRNIDYEKLKLIDETYNSMFDENSYYEKKHFKQYLNKIDFSYENFEQIIEKNENRDDD